MNWSHQSSIFRLASKTMFVQTGLQVPFLFVCQWFYNRFAITHSINRDRAWGIKQNVTFYLTKFCIVLELMCWWQPCKYPDNYNYQPTRNISHLSDGTVVTEVATVFTRSDAVLWPLSADLTKGTVAVRPVMDGGLRTWPNAVLWLAVTCILACKHSPHNILRPDNEHRRSRSWCTLECPEPASVNMLFVNTEWLIVTCPPLTLVSAMHLSPRAQSVSWPH